MVGGTEGQFAQWSPLFRSLSREPRLVGPAGKAASLKLALNQLIALEISAFAMILGLVQRTNVQGLCDSDYSVIFEVVNPIP